MANTLQIILYIAKNIPEIRLKEMYEFNLTRLIRNEEIRDMTGKRVKEEK